MINMLGAVKGKKWTAYKKPMGNIIRGFLGSSVVKNPPAMQKIQVWSGKIPWTEEPGRLYSLWGCRVRHD